MAPNVRGRPRVFDHGFSVTRASRHISARRALRLLVADLDGTERNPVLPLPPVGGGAPRAR